MRKWLFAIPVSTSALGWAMIPAVTSARGPELEGALFLAGYAGMAATVLTGPLTIAVLGATGALHRLSLAQYIGVLQLVAIPALTFQTYVVSASSMGLFIGAQLMQQPEPALHVLLAGTFTALYGAIGLISYPFLKANPRRAAAVAVVIVVALAVFLAVRF